MKRLISLLVVITMLAGMCITAGAALPETTQYVFNGAGTDKGVLGTDNFVQNNKSGSPIRKVHGKVHGQPAKYGDDVWYVSAPYEHNDINIALNGDSINTHGYVEGEKVHMTTEIMVPSTNDPISRYAQSQIGLNVVPLVKDGSDALVKSTNGVHVPVAGTSAGITDILALNTSTMRFDVFGNVSTNEAWEYDKWYRLDIVMVMGQNPQAALYVNGSPLTVSSGTDATFDGQKTTTDYVNVGVWDAEKNFVASPIWGVGEFYLQTVLNNNGYSNSKLYIDNMVYESLAATDEADIPTPLSLMGLADGAGVDRALLANATVSLPEWNAHLVKKVSLSIDGAEALVDDAAPFGFDLSTIIRGVRNIELKALDAEDNVLVSRNQTIVVGGKEEVVFLDCDFNMAWNVLLNHPIYNGPIYASANPHYANRNDMTETRHIDIEDVTDGAETPVTKTQAVKLFSSGTDDNARFGWINDTQKATTGIVKVSYDYLVKNDDITQILIKPIHKNIPTLKYVASESGEGGYYTSDNDYRLNTKLNIPAAFDRWQRWDWTIDLSRGQISLDIDGEKAIDAAQFIGANDYADEGKGFQISFKGKEDPTNFVAIDNAKITYETGFTAYENDMYDHHAGKAYSEYTYDEIMAQPKIFAYNYGGTKIPVGTEGGAVYGDTIMNAEDTAPLNASIQDSLVVEFDGERVVTDGTNASADTYVLPFYVSRGLKKDPKGTSNILPEYGMTTIEYDFYTDNYDYKEWYVSFATMKVMGTNPNRNGGTAGTSLMYNLYYPGFSLNAGKWQNHKIVLMHRDGAVVDVYAYADGKLIKTANMEGNNWSRYHETNLQFVVKGKADPADETKYAPSRIALDNVKVSYTPIVPHIESVSFAGADAAYGKVANITEGAIATVNMAGFDMNNLSSKISVTDSEGTPVEIIPTLIPSTLGLPEFNESATSNLLQARSFTLPIGSLEVGKTYTIKVDSGLAFDRQKNVYIHHGDDNQGTAGDSVLLEDNWSYSVTTREPSTYTFTVVESLPVAEIPDDGVAGDITVLDARFTTGAADVATGIVAPYVGGTAIPAGKLLRADMKVNNASATAQTVYPVLATYSDNKLVGIALGTPETVHAKAENVTVTSGSVVVGTEANLTAKAFLLNDLVAISPLSGTYDISTVAAE
ncbi:MAG: hypothetical protein E7409_07305 [Ruminococcaceae bacterium]|nr:hypothetical protein [Oscillospiraceae bacterium]